jgi:D-sedoheptulose 7-phosphate isomerase
MTMTPDVAATPSHPAANYFERLGEMYRFIKVSDAAGAPLDFEAGVEAVIRKAIETHDGGGKLMFVGNGGSSAIASHMSIDYWKNGGLRSTAFNDPALLTCLSNDYGYEYVFEKPIRMFGAKGDLLIAISSSGKSPNILKAAEAAREIGCFVVTLSGFGVDNPLRLKGDVNFYVPSDSYGYVELTHLSVCHCILDLACERPRG